MTRLLYAPASPYSAKVRMAAAHLGVVLDAEVVDTNAAPADLLSANPLGKIPSLVTSDGDAVFDSRVIMRFLDRASGGGLYPSDPARALRVERLEALADGICDCLLAHVYERRSRPAEKVHTPWLDKQWQKVERALTHLDAHLPQADSADAGSFALRAALGYLALRFKGEWEGRHPGLGAWVDQFDRAFPKLAALPPA